MSYGVSGYGELAYGELTAGGAYDLSGASVSTAAATGGLTSARFAAQVPPYLPDGSDAASGMYAHLSTSGHKLVAQMVFKQLKAIQL